jgi:hypothetical protein
VTLRTETHSHEVQGSRGVTSYDNHVSEDDPCSLARIMHRFLTEKDDEKMSA